MEVSITVRYPTHTLYNLPIIWDYFYHQGFTSCDTSEASKDSETQSSSQGSDCMDADDRRKSNEKEIHITPDSSSDSRGSCSSLSLGKRLFSGTMGLFCGSKKRARVVTKETEMASHQDECFIEWSRSDSQSIGKIKGVVETTFPSIELHTHIMHKEIKSLSAELNVNMGVGSSQLFMEIIHILERCTIFNDNAAIWTICVSFSTYTWNYMGKHETDTLTIPTHILSCAIIIHKFYMDNPYENVYLAEQLGLPLYLVNMTERNILNSLNHRIPFELIEINYQAFHNSLDSR